MHVFFINKVWLMLSTDTGSYYVRIKCTYATSLGTFKRQFDEHHLTLLWHFASLPLLYNTLDLLTSGHFCSVYSGVMQICYGESASCLFVY